MALVILDAIKTISRKRTTDGIYSQQSKKKRLDESASNAIGGYSNPPDHSLNQFESSSSTTNSGKAQDLLKLLSSKPSTSSSMESNPQLTSSTQTNAQDLLASLLLPNKEKESNKKRKQPQTATSSSKENADIDMSDMFGHAKMFFGDTEKKYQRKDRIPRTVEIIHELERGDASHADLLAKKWLSFGELAELEKSIGLKYKKGRFSLTEDKAIEDFLNRYKSTQDWNDDQLREMIFDKKKNKDKFWSELTEQLPQRPLMAVYSHVHRIWHPMSNKGRWTTQEDKVLEEAYRDHPRQWSKISEYVQRTPRDCIDRYRTIFTCRDRKVGKWSEDEVAKFISIVKPMMNERDYQTRDGSDPFWSIVQEKMNNKRSAHQCRVKWEEDVSTIVNQRKDSTFKMSDYGELIRRIMSLKINDESEISWRSLSQNDYKDEWSARTLRSKWRYIQRTSSPDWKTLPYTELLKAIKRVYGDIIDGSIDSTKADNEVVGDDEHDDSDSDNSGQTYTLEVSADMEMDNLYALLEVESEIPSSEQIITHLDKQLSNDSSRTLKDEGVTADTMLGLRRKVQVAGREVAHDGEMMRLQLLGNRDILDQMKQVQPELADAAENNPTKFYELMQQAVSNKHVAEAQQAEMLNSDPFNVEAQKHIEEQIRQQAVAESFERAIEYNPETFGMVEMLYIDTEVNKKPVKAFVDSGAQSTIMSPKCAEACNLMRLLDTRFQGIAQGVGTAKILGRIHAAPMRIGDIFLQCSFTVTEGSGVDLLFGLDMLKRHQAIIDLRQNALIIQEKVIPFLAVGTILSETVII
ncbi:hypothetical protein E3Q11_02399 [Wallemia mellicola]|nr:hypothetical protein E3Q11_02399 [Wallemia mellicola]